MPEESGILFLLVVMKVPVFFCMWIIWKAIKAEPDPLDDGDWNWGGEPEPGQPTPSHGKNPWKSPSRTKVLAREKV